MKWLLVFFFFFPIVCRIPIEILSMVNGSSQATVGSGPEKESEILVQAFGVIPPVEIPSMVNESSQGENVVVDTIMDITALIPNDVGFL